VRGRGTSIIQRARCPVLTLWLICLIDPSGVVAQSRVERNVVYGMVSGTALLLDVHQPEVPNGRGVVFVAGNAWTSLPGYGTAGLKESQIGDWAPALLRAGYTVFAINHRATPRFRFPEPVEDVQRAVRFVRHHAKRFGIDPERVGGLGGSSGGHLIGLTAMLGAPGIAEDSDAVNREPARLRAVVLRAAPSDMRAMLGANPIATAAVVTFVNRMPTPSADDQKAYRAASPLTHVSAAAPPVLLLHGDADDTVPIQQSVAMEAALQKVGVPVRLLRVAGGAHGSDFGTGGKPHPQFADVVRETVEWFDRHLK
jgi:acetyl esterase/lipase